MSKLFCIIMYTGPKVAPMVVLRYITGSSESFRLVFQHADIHSRN